MNHSERAVTAALKGKSAVSYPRHNPSQRSRTHDQAVDERGALGERQLQ
jgi:hypothetical protein